MKAEETSAPSDGVLADISLDEQAASLESAIGVASERAIDAEALTKLASLRERLQARVGEVVLAMMNLPRYRHQTLADLMHLVLDPLMHDRIAIATARAPGGASVPQTTPAGMVIWASVSDEVDAKIADQISGGSFPIRLANDDWRSGDTLWLLDVIAPSRKLATLVLTNFRQIAGERPVKIHPVVVRSVDAGTVESMKVQPEVVTG